MARTYLAVPASSAPCKREFSAGWHIQDYTCNHIVETLKALICLNNWVNEEVIDSFIDDVSDRIADIPRVYRILDSTRYPVGYCRLSVSGSQPGVVNSIHQLIHSDGHLRLAIPLVSTRRLDLISTINHSGTYTKSVHTHTLNMVPTRIWLSFKNVCLRVETEELEYVNDLAQAAQKKFAALSSSYPSDITLHTTEQAEALDSRSTLAEIATLLTPCGDRKTPLIVKVKPNVAPETPVPVHGIPRRIYLYFKKCDVDVPTTALETVEDLARAARIEFPPLHDFYTADISLHTSADAEALNPGSKLAAIAEQLSLCGDRKTPLIVQVKPNVAPETPVPVHGIPARICLYFKEHHASVPTTALETVEDLARAAKIEFPPLQNSYTADISLHTSADVEALNPGSKLAAIAEQLPPCGDSKSPLIVKVKPNVGEPIVRFWMNLPEAILVGEGEGKYLELRIRMCSEIDGLASASSCDQFTKSSVNILSATVTNPDGPLPPFSSSPSDPDTYLMTSGGVESLIDGSLECRKARANPKTVYIVDGRAPRECEGWTLLVTSPQEVHYKHMIQAPASALLYMAPWSYGELQRCKAILCPDEEKLPTTLMNNLFDWYGGVPRYVIQKVSEEYANGTALGDEKAVFERLIAILTAAINKGSIRKIIQAHQDRNREGEHSHRVLHLCRHPNGNLNQFHVAWASLEVENAVVTKYEQEIRTEWKNFLQTSDELACGNLRGLLFEPYAQTVLQDGGKFKVRRLCEDHPSDQNVEVTFREAKLKHF
ncbi:hypothetical protein PSHT_14945 [Puccinia striiformis]|uniref:HAT C-terminal dimerisation domain-containing protein n=1 Tax=Puccinia striiformis TaxID=27350 RepID=A0A2S4UHV6_9BASI|nr:hypothetical protein PSHT_14945 [Puccinia striiformis]